MVPDFSGWATKVNMRCADGRTILKDAFAHMDGKRVPLVFMHAHNTIENVLGYAILKHVDGQGTRADAYFNSTPAGQNAKLQVEHGDLDSLSIYANNLSEEPVKRVAHGDIKEVSLVLAGANPGAKIDFVNIRHSDGSYDELDDEAIITSGEVLFHSDQPADQQQTDASQGDQNGGQPKLNIDAWNEFTPEQQDFVAFLVEEAVKNAEAGGDPDGDGDDDTTAEGVVNDQQQDAAHSNIKAGEGDLSHKEGATDVSRNVFDQTNQSGTPASPYALSHSDTKTFFEDAKKAGSLNAALESYLDEHTEVRDHALKHGIEPIDVLFPNYTNLTNTPQFLSRRMEWVDGVLSGTSKTPFSRVKSIVADITMDEARALGYIKGTMKKEEWFSVSKRTTDSTTVYKKQKLDRDDIIDITDFDVVAWMKGEMSVMLREEIARAILIGDGRAVDDPDKIQDPMNAASGSGIRSIVNENDLYKTDVHVNVGDANSTMLEVQEAILRSMRYYKGTGTPTFYTTLPTLTSLLLVKDQMGRRYWNSKADLAAAMGVKDIVTVEVMETMPNLFGIIVNLADYNIGSNKGGEVTLFDFFDIDYNQYKYLSETRISGALTRPKSALVVWSTAATDVQATPDKPTFNKSTGVVTIPNKTGVVYKNTDTGATLTAGAQTALTSGQTLNVFATPASGYYFENQGALATEWSFYMPSA
jgi:phage head maturation protease